MGVAPLAYLLGWRMRLAERALCEGTMPVSALARTLGYRSESAFSNTFKRTVGIAPRRYRTAARGAMNPASMVGGSETIEGQRMAVGP